MDDQELFIGDLADGFGGVGTAIVSSDQDPTTLDFGEEGDDQPTTMMTGEEGDDEPTTMATGEEGDDQPEPM